MVDASGAGAASVASRLLAFLREPARFRPHYLHGDEPLPTGHMVLKFALGRFAAGWRRDLPHHDQEQLGEAARAFVRQVCLWERATHYQVLCLDRHASRDEIKENYRLLMALLHPDRQDAAAAAWPADSAQRVNDAYAVLSGDALRREYDQTLRKARSAAPFEPPASSPRNATVRRRGFARPFLVVSTMLAALFAVQSWWMSDVPQHYALLERSLSLRASAQWVRDALPTELPRFMDSKPAMAFDPLAFLVPSKPPSRLAPVAVWEPVAPPVKLPESSVPPAPAPSASPAIPAIAPRDAVTREIAAPTLRLAQAPASSGVVSSAGAATQPTPGAPSSEEIELLVARLVSYYEAGDADKLVGLFDPDAVGIWKSFRTRGAYADFFSATRERRLRMNRLNWQSAAQSAQARGDATVFADYTDGGGKLERRVDVEIDIGMRDGQARITRLLLFPVAQ